MPVCLFTIRKDGTEHMKNGRPFCSEELKPKAKLQKHELTDKLSSSIGGGPQGTHTDSTHRRCLFSFFCKSRRTSLGSLHSRPDWLRRISFHPKFIYYRFLKIHLPVLYPLPRQRRTPYWVPYTRELNPRGRRTRLWQPCATVHRLPA